jgi:hypothetical protein
MGKISFRSLLVMSVVGMCLLTGGCNSSQALPPAARQAVEESAQAVYIDSHSPNFGFDRVMEIHFSRAWRAEKLPEGIISSGEDIQVWCVELSVRGQRQGTGISENPIWMAIQEGSGKEWVVQPLMMFSAIWPYESCGQSPGE